MISRRRFLGALGAGSAAVLAGCHSGRSTPSRSVPPSTPSPPASASHVVLPSTPSRSVPPSTARPSPVRPRTWAQLRAKLGGRLVLPSDPGYATARLGYNPRFDWQRPAAVARCAHPADVQACVEFAAATHTRIAARSGGHSYVGYSTPDRGLVVDVGALSTVDVRSDGTVVVGAGARLMDVYAALAAAHRCLPAGSCPTVGIAGLTLGGGIGLLARAYGLTCDRLVSAQVVTADGMLRTASATSTPDLFWALRGGGGGNFGVVTSFTFRTVPAPALTVFSLQFPGKVLGAWQDWMASAPDELFTDCIVHGSTPASAQVGGCFVGTPGQLTPLLDALVRRAGAPTSRYVTAMTYLDAMRYAAGCSQLTAAQCAPSWTGTGGTLQRETFVASSLMVMAPMRDPDAVVGAIEGSGLDALFDSLGGAVGRVGAAETAFPHRAALASLQLYRGGTRSVAAVRDRLSALLGNHGYINYIDPSVPATAYYGANLPRLRSTAERYDPDRVFAFAQGLA